MMRLHWHLKTILTSPFSATTLVLLTLMFCGQKPARIPWASVWGCCKELRGGRREGWAARSVRGREEPALAERREPARELRALCFLPWAADPRSRVSIQCSPGRCSL